MGRDNLPKQLIQIAGVRTLDEARLLLAAGVDWIGLPLRLPVHCPDLSETEASRLVRALPAGSTVVLITYEYRAAALAAFCRELTVRHVQIHGDITLAELKALRRLAPDLHVLKSLVVRPTNQAELRETVARLSPHLDAFITDTYDPATGACGATGRTHDWSISRELVALSPVPVILAGGLTPLNVRRAILEVRPAGVDAHTGVENAEGNKDASLVRRFIEEARAGFSALPGT